MKKVTEIVSIGTDGKLEGIFMEYQNASTSNYIKLWNASSMILYCDMEYEIDPTWVNKWVELITVHAPLKVALQARRNGIGNRGVPR